MPRPSGDLQQLKFNWLTLDDFHFMCFITARTFMSEEEPIPDWETVNLNLLESSLGNPRQGTKSGLLYPDFESQASILFYSLIKNHPFENGNKRIAVMTLWVFCFINDYDLEIDPVEMYRIAIDVAESKKEQKDLILRKLKRTIKDRLAPR